MVYDSNFNLGVYGGTGGPGASGSSLADQHMGSHSPSEPLLNNPSQSVEQFALEVAYRGLVGATGGAGGIPPTVEEARQKGITMTSMREELAAKVDRMEKSEEIIEELRNQYSEFNIVQGKANSQVAYCAFRMGVYLLRLQGIRSQQNKRDWVEWSEKHIHFISKRSREKYMAIAGLPCVESHLAYGVELLSEVGSVYSSLKDEDAKALDPDPIAMLLKSGRINAEAQYEDRKALLEAVVHVKRLERQGIIISLDHMLRFLKDNKPFTSEERRYLKDMAQKDEKAPQFFLEKFFEEKRDRKDFIPKPTTEATAPATELAGQAEGRPETGTLKPSAIPNIDVQVATLDESFDAYLTQEAELPRGVDVDALERLAAKALELVKKFKEAMQGDPQ